MLDTMAVKPYNGITKEAVPMTFWRKREKERMETVRPGPGLWWELPASTSAQKYAVTPEEERFFAAFHDALQNSRKSTFFKLTRMADGAISVRNDRGSQKKALTNPRFIAIIFMFSGL